MTSDPRVAEAERAFMEAAERYARAMDAGYLKPVPSTPETRTEHNRAADAFVYAHRALEAARAGKEAGRGEPAVSVIVCDGCGRPQEEHAEVLTTQGWRAWICMTSRWRYTPADAEAGRGE